MREDLVELISRILGSNFFGFYLLYRIQMKFQGGFFFASRNYFEWIQWLLIVFPFFIFFGSYLFRLPAKAVANRFREIVFPFWVALIPFGVYESNRLAYVVWIRKTEFLNMLFTPFYPLSYQGFYSAGSVFIFLGDLLAFCALLYLYRSFSIMVEVRNLQIQGPYRWIRHPMYSGEILATIGFCLFKFSYFNIFLTLLFTICIVLRAKFEENKIIQIYPEYEKYQSETGFLFPKPKI